MPLAKHSSCNMTWMAQSVGFNSWLGAIDCVRVSGSSIQRMSTLPSSACSPWAVPSLGSDPEESVLALFSMPQLSQKFNRY